jgi:hypothetical protein
MTNEAQQANNPFGIPDTVAAPAAPKEELDAFGLRKKYVKISIYEDNSPGAEAVCKVGINGRVFLMKRGVEHIVPVAVKEVLDQAIQNVLVKGEGQLITRAAKRFPYQWHGDATEAEYRTYQEQMRKEQEARSLQATA